MLPDRVSNPGPLTYESGALPIALRGSARRVKTSKLSPPAPTASAIGPCPTLSQSYPKCPGTGSLPRTSHHPTTSPPQSFVKTTESYEVSLAPSIGKPRMTPVSFVKTTESGILRQYYDRWMDDLRFYVLFNSI